jgi:hypothetical protein
MPLSLGRVCLFRDILDLILPSITTGQLTPSGQFLVNHLLVTGARNRRPGLTLSPVRLLGEIMSSTVGLDVVGSFRIFCTMQFLACSFSMRAMSRFFRLFLAMRYLY